MIVHGSVEWAMTTPPRVVVVGETPSLGRSVSYLLDAAGIPIDTVATLDPITSRSPTLPPLIIAASSGPMCATARRWLQGAYPGSDLIVVGSRDPTVSAAPSIHQVALPLRPGDLLELVRQRIAHLKAVARTPSPIAPR